MKKVMKKTLSIMLALVMVMSLTTVTAKAADTVLVTATIENVAASGVGEYYLMPDAGTYKVSIEGATGFIVMGYWESPFYQTRMVDDAGVASFTVTTNPLAPMGVQQISFAVMNNTESTQNYTVTVSVEGSGNAGSGSANALAIGTNSVPVTVENYYCAGTEKIFTATEAGTYILSAAEGEMNADVGVLGAYGIDWITLPYEFDLNANESITFIVCTSAYMTLTEDTIDLVLEKKDERVLELGTNSVPVTVENYYCAGTEKIFTATEAGTYILSAAEGEMNADVGVLGAYGIDWITLPYEFDLNANENITFIVCTSAYMTLTEDTIDLVLTKTEQSGSETSGTGTEEEPYTMIIGDNTATLAEEDTYLYYAYTATEQGALVITMCDDNASWFYAGYVNTYDVIEQFVNPNKTWTTNTNESTDAEPVSVRRIYLETGDKVVLKVSTAKDASWTRPAGTVVFETSFLSGVQQDGGETQLQEYVVDYDTKLVFGENALTLDPSAYTTIYEFEPTEAGVFKFTVNDGNLLGYWGSGTFFVFDQTENKTNVLEKEIKEDEVGNSIMVGVEGAGNCTVVVEKVDDASDRVTIPEVEYENIITPVSYTYEGSDVEYVDVWDDEINTAVLGEDGLYHLDSADGPVLFVDLADTEFVNLFDAYCYGQLNGATYENGTPVLKTDYNAAWLQYYNAAETGLYPMTTDLVVMMSDIGNNQGWYTEGSWVGGTTPEEAWMYNACYSVELTTMEVPFEIPENYIPDADEGVAGGTTGSTTNGTTEGTSSSTSNETVTTGDNASIVVWVIAMVVAAGAAFVVAESKKRTR